MATEILPYIREFTADDYPMVASWWEGHGQYAPRIEFLPPLGIILFEEDEDGKRDIAALWLHLSLSCGVSFLEPAVSVPGLTVAKAALAFRSGIEFLKKRASAMNYDLMLVRTYPAIARILRKSGFDTDGRTVFCLAALTKENICQL